MKEIKQILIIVCMLLSGSNSMSAMQDIEINISTEKKCFCKGEPILLMAEVKNRGTGSIVLRDGEELKWTIYEENDKCAKKPLTPKIFIGSRRVREVELSAGESKLYYKWLNDELDVLKTGCVKFKVLVNYMKKNETKERGDVKSMKVSVKKCSEKALNEFIQQRILKIKRLDSGEHLTISENQLEILQELERIKRIEIEEKELLYAELLNLSEFTLIQGCINELKRMETKASNKILSNLREKYYKLVKEEKSTKIDNKTNRPINTKKNRNFQILKWLE